MTGQQRLAEGVTVGSHRPEAGQRGISDEYVVETAVSKNHSKTLIPELSGETETTGLVAKKQKGDQVGRTFLLTTPFIEHR
jgi:hypothetical protein